MAKHIIGQALYQLIVLLIFLFYGPHFLIDEYNDESQLADPGNKKLKII